MKRNINPDVFMTSNTEITIKDIKVEDNKSTENQPVINVDTLTKTTENTENTTTSCSSLTWEGYTDLKHTRFQKVQEHPEEQQL